MSWSWRRSCTLVLQLLSGLVACSSQSAISPANEAASPPGADVSGDGARTSSTKSCDTGERHSHGTGDGGTSVGGQSGAWSPSTGANAHESSSDVGAQINSVRPSHAAGGASVRILGKGFGDGTGASVRFRHNTAQILSWSADEIVVQVPEDVSAGLQELVLHHDGGTTTTIYWVDPQARDIVPRTVRTGQSISIEGSNFGSYQHANAVTIGGVSADVLLWGMTHIVACVPALPDGAAEVVVHVSTATSKPTSIVVSPDAPSAAGPTFVSLTFDDTFDSQFQVGEVLAPFGMHATFYVNSPRIDKPGFMTLAQIQALRKGGHEIGGHTLNHLHLTVVDEGEQRRQICDDRKRLLELGLLPRSFAYPGGRQSDAIQGVIAECGYLSARMVNGGRETVPVTRPMAVRTSAVVKSTTTLETMQSWITKAEATGGWVTIVFHPICDGCHPDSVARSNLENFVGWLATRHDRGTVVRTVHEMVGGELKPAVGGPPPPAPEAGPNLLRNASLELDTNGDGVPDCWATGNAGGTSWWSRSNHAALDSWAQQFSPTGATTYGDRRLNTLQDMGACAPPIHAGEQYTVSMRYISSSMVAFNAYYRDAESFWRMWTGSPSFPESSNWARATWTLPPAPNDATAVSVGAVITSDAPAILDDFSLRVTAP